MSAQLLVGELKTMTFSIHIEDDNDETLTHQELLQSKQVYVKHRKIQTIILSL